MDSQLSPCEGGKAAGETLALGLGSAPAAKGANCRPDNTSRLAYRPQGIIARLGALVTVPPREQR